MRSLRRRQVPSSIIREIIADQTQTKDEVQRAMFDPALDHLLQNREAQPQTRHTQPTSSIGISFPYPYLAIPNVARDPLFRSNKPAKPKPKITKRKPCTNGDTQGFLQTLQQKIKEVKK